MVVAKPRLLLAGERTQQHDQNNGDTLKQNPLRHHPVLLNPERFLRCVTGLADVLSVPEKRHQPPEERDDYGNREAADQHHQKERHDLNLRKAGAGTARNFGKIEQNYRIAGVGVAVPGLVDTVDGRVLIAPHLGWRDCALTSTLARVLHFPVYAGNDASLAAIAESLFGAARGAKDLVYLNGSASGIGGGLIIGGSPLRGTSGYAGELGHTLVNSNGVRCHCGRIGCLETEVSMSRLLRVLGLPRADLDDLDIALGVSRDPQVLREVMRQIDFLSVAISDFVNMFDPKMVVLGGFLGSLLSVGRERLAEAVSVSSIGSLGHAVLLERAQLRSRLMIVGAAELAFAGLLDDPAGFVRGRTGV